MMKTEYVENGGFLQMDSVEHEEYAEAYSTESRKVTRKDGADLLGKEQKGGIRNPPVFAKWVPLCIACRFLWRFSMPV